MEQDHPPVVFYRVTLIFIMSNTKCPRHCVGMESCSRLPVKNTNVGEGQEERMGFIDQEVREEMVGVSKPSLGTPSLPSPPSVPSQQTKGTRMGTFQKPAIPKPLQTQLSPSRSVRGRTGGNKRG